MSHGRVVCSCGKVISQCKCMNHGHMISTIKAGCDDCKSGHERSHLIDGKFQSDKYPLTPRGLVPLSPNDPMAQDLLWEYAQRRREIDTEFSDDLEEALRLCGYEAVSINPG